MNRWNKSLALILLIAVLSMSMGIFNLTIAQTPNYSDHLATPTVPKFTLNFIQSAPNKTETDLYTRVNTTMQVPIEIEIKNQPFSPYPFSWTEKGTTYYGSTFLWYELQAKAHSSQDWTEVFIPLKYTNQTNSSGYTVLALPQSLSFIKPVNSTVIGPAGGQVDFRVRAIICGFFPPTLPSGIYPTLNYVSKNSSWSNPQTITIPASSKSPSPTPQSLPIANVTTISVVVLAVVAAGLLVYFKKHRQNQASQT
jgi:hypothetical protein